MGYNQKFPLAVVYGPKSVGALDLVDLTMEQGIRAVESFLYHKFATDGVSRLMDIFLRYSQMEAGRAEPLLQKPDITIPYLTNTWLTNMRDFMANHNFQIETSNEWSMRPQCENDTMLMEYFASRGVSKYKLRHLNACWMFLQQVSSIADIATADGVQIHQNSLDCKHITTRRSPLRWPNQPEPTLHQEQDWKDCLTRYLLTSGSKWKRTLKTQLGASHSQPSMEWLTKLHQATRTPWSFNIETKQWKIFQNISIRPTILKFDIAAEGMASLAKQTSHGQCSM